MDVIELLSRKNIGALVLVSSPFYSVCMVVLGMTGYFYVFWVGVFGLRPQVCAVNRGFFLYSDGFFGLETNKIGGYL